MLQPTRWTRSSPRVSTRRREVVGPVAHPAGRVDRQRVGVAVAAEVHRERADAARSRPAASSGCCQNSDGAHVPVHEDDGLTGPGGLDAVGVQDLLGQPRRLDPGGDDAGQQQFGHVVSWVGPAGLHTLATVGRPRQRSGTRRRDRGHPGAARSADLQSSRCPARAPPSTPPGRGGPRRPAARRAAGPSAPSRRPWPDAGRARATRATGGRSPSWSSAVIVGVAWDTETSGPPCHAADLRVPGSR